MDMIWLEDFSALVSTGNFSRAAVLRHVTQPAFSRRIRALEDWFGVPLFDREAQPVTLTTAGRRFEPAAQDMLWRIAQTRDDVREAASQTPTLRFAATHVLSFTFFPAWFHRLEDGRMPTSVQLMSDSFQACEQRMLLGHVQFLLCHHHTAAPTQLEEARFPSILVGADALCLVAAPAVARRTQAPLPMLAYSRESGLGRIVAAAMPRGAAAQPVFTSHLAAALRTMALDGRGVAWLPLSLIDADLAAGTLVRTTTAEIDIALEIRVFRPATRQDQAAETLWDRLCAVRQPAQAAHGATERPVSSVA